MSVFDKTRYLRALFILLPIGIAFTYWGIEGITKDVDDLPQIKGSISDIKEESLFYETCDCYKNTLLIYLQGHKLPFKTKIVKNIEILKPILTKGQNVEIWIWDKTNDNRIEQLKINGEMIIPYNRTLVLYLGFLLIGLVLLLLCVFYIIKSPEDLFDK